MNWLDPLRFSLAAALVLLIPGGSLLVWLRGEQAGKGSDVEKAGAPVLADAAALSISAAALLALWLSITGIKVGAAGVYLFYAVGLLLLVFGTLRLGKTGSGFRFPAARAWLWILALGFVVSLAAWRFYQSRDLVLPAWVDSVHHTLIVRKIIEYQGIPPDLTPYFPAPFFYHYGFHLVTALFAFWTHLSPASAVLWFGNVINALVALSVYRAADTFWQIGNTVREEQQSTASGSSAALNLSTRTLWRKPTMAALSAALLTGFVFQMPAYYVTWGRYTLLTGLILLGPLISAAWEVWQAPLRKGARIRLAILTAGMCLTHYFALLLAGFFLGILAVFMLAQSLRRSASYSALLRMAGWVTLGLLLASPWIWRVSLASREMMNVSMVNPITQDETAVQGSKEYLKYLVYLAGPRRNHILLGMAGIGLLAALRRANLRPLSIWAVFLILFALPWGLRLGPFRPDHYVIVLFFPASILLGSLLVEGVETLSRLVQPGTLERAWFRPTVLSIVLSVFLVWGMRDSQRVLNKTTLIADRSDLAALNWIQSHTSTTARFYINSVLWQGTTYRGVDGGYWLMPYTGRFSLIPPAMYSDAPAETVEQVNQWAEKSSQLRGCGDEFWSLVEDAHLTHVYLHQDKGRLQPSSLASCPGLSVVYKNDNVSIYQINPQP